MIQANNAGETDDIIAARQQEARQITLQRILAGLVPQPRDIKCLAVNSNAPAEWVAQLDAWSQEIEDLSVNSAKNGKLKGMQEQRKMSILTQFVSFLQGLGAENFQALLTGSSLSLALDELKDANSSRRQHLDSVLDGLFCS